MSRCEKWSLLGGLFLTVGCGSGSFPTSKVTGKVLCKGVPVANVRVFFEPLQTGKSAIVGKSGYGVADKEGAFVLSTYGDGDGAVVGRHRVRVDRPHPEDFPGFQCDCATNSEVDVMEVDVAAGRVNSFEVVLREKNSEVDRPSLDDAPEEEAESMEP
jgi:hypothetical protein